MLSIVPIQPFQIADAKSVISAVAQRIYVPDKSPDEFLEDLDEEHELDDVDNYQQVYNGHNGLFLVVLDDERVVGTGAVRYWDDEIAELKRLWLLEEYHGQGIGYRVVTLLFDFARAHGYRRVRLQTGHKQERAVRFYKRLGFYDIPSYNEDMDEISMEIRL